MALSQAVLVIGGGIGGIVAAKTLRKRVPRSCRIVVFERSAEHWFAPSYLWLMTGDRKSDQISRPISRLTRKGIEVVHGSVERIVPSERKVVSGGREYVGDYLVVATGAELAPELVPGLMEAGHNLYTVEGASTIREARTSITRGRIVVLVCSMPFKCPAAPYEAAMLLESDSRRRGLHNAVRVALYSPELGPMPVTGPKVSAQVRQMVESRGVDYFPQHAVKSVDAAKRVIHFADGHSTEFDLLVYVPPHRAPAVVSEAGLLGPSGWVPVDKETLETKFPRVYAIGDVAGIMLSNGKPLPKAGVLAHREAEVVANNIAVSINGRGAREKFDGYGECFLEAGGGRAGMGKGSFYAEPDPDIQLKSPSRLLHAGKVAFEKYWLYRL